MNKQHLLAILLVAFGTSLSTAQQTPSRMPTMSSADSISNTSPATAKQMVSPTNTPVSIPSAWNLSNQTQQSIQNQIAQLQEKIDSATKKTDWLFNVMFIVLGIGTFTSVISWIKHEWFDSRRLESRANESHALYVQGERASQVRSEEVHRTFLSSSKDTLDLVNATLTLAKQASERAAKSVEDRAKVILQQLDIDSKDLLASVPAQDDRALVADPARTATLRSLAQRIEGFQINRLVLPEAMQLSSECLFIRGMDFHLKQQYDDSFKAWREVTHRNETPPSLRGLAWYWIGYEQNNLGQFKEATLSFQRALETAVGVRKFEIQRILIESRFFNKEASEVLLASLKMLVESANQCADEGIEPVRKKILGTIGNIHLQMGNCLRIAKDIEKAKTQYRLAKEYFEEARSDLTPIAGHFIRRVPPQV